MKIVRANAESLTILAHYRNDEAPLFRVFILVSSRASPTLDSIPSEDENEKHIFFASLLVLVEGDAKSFVCNGHRA